MLVSCSLQRSGHQPPAAPERAWIDLQPRWRIRVVAPLPDAAKFSTLPESACGGTITMQAPPGFGYNTYLFALDPRRGGGVRLRFLSATATVAGKSSPATQPRPRLFDFPARFRYLRVFYLVRSSAADHDMAIIAAQTPQARDALTQAVRANPAQCRPAPDATCSYLPPGVAVVPERPAPGAPGWVPIQ